MTYVHDVLFFLSCHVSKPADKHTVRLYTWRQDNKYYAIQVLRPSLTGKNIQFFTLYKNRIQDLNIYSDHHIYIHYFTQKTQYKGKQTTKRIVKYAYNNKQKVLCDTRNEGNC